MTTNEPETITFTPQKLSRSIKFKAWTRRTASNVLVWLVQLINDIDRKLTGHDLNPNPNKFEDLGPNPDADKNTVYEQFLLWALKKRNVSNIAFTGPYGSGKSSVITTFQHKHKEFHYLNISLAMFDKEFKRQDDWRQKVELSILQQLIYHVKNKKLPDSRFKKINHTSKTEMFFVTLGLILLGISFFNIYKPDFIDSFSWWKSLPKHSRDLINTITLVYFVIGLSAILYKFYRSLKNFRFSKVGLTDGQLELADKDDKSIFNKHLDEIIYFFEVTPFNVVIIEDLDRFEDAEIFTKLREVNSLINNSQQVGRPVNFVYAVRDDMFKDKDRAKFFDIIIPVIPVINTSNAGDELGKKLVDIKLEEPVKGGFLNTVTLYIQDMRLLINILNEFKVYLTQIGKDLNPQKLLAIIIYKNIYPDEFAKLHNQSGDVFNLIDSKKNYISAEVTRLDEEIKVLQQELDKLTEMRLVNINELKSVYLTAIFSELKPFSLLRINGTDMAIKDLLTGDVFDQLTSLSSFPYRYFTLDNYSVQATVLDKTFGQIEKNIHPNPYNVRKKQLEDIAQSRINLLRKGIADLNRRKSEIQGYTIHQIMNLKESFTVPEGISDKPLLVYLVGEGHVDEHYPMYISYFIEGSLAQADIEFIRSIAQRKALGFSHKLKNVDTIVTKWLNIGNYSQPEILNISFVDWILQHLSSEAEILNLFELLSSANARSMNFIHEYLTTGSQKHKFLISLSEHFAAFWDVIYQDSSLSDEDLDNYVYLILTHINIDRLPDVNASLSLSHYLENKINAAPVLEMMTDQENLKKALNKLKVKFVHLPFNERIKSVTEYCYRHNLYVLSPENIALITRKFPELTEPATQDDLAIRQFTVLRSSKATELLDYIQEDINNYVANVLQKDANNNQESEETFTYLLNHPNLKDYLMEEVTRTQTALISNVAEVDAAYVEGLFVFKKAVLNWQNIFCYFNITVALDDTLISFLNQSQDLSKLRKIDWKTLMTSDDSKVVAGELETALLTANGLDIEIYRVIAEHAHFSYEELEIEELNDDKVAVLIELETLDFSEANLTVLAKDFTHLLLDFVLRHEDAYFELGTKLPSSFYIGLILSEDIDIAKKIKFLKILTPDDLIHESDLCISLGNLLNDQQSEIPEFTMEFRVSLIKNLRDLDDKLDFMVNLGRYLKPENIIEILKSLPDPYSSLIVPGKKPAFFIDNYMNNRFLLFLDVKLPDIISSVTVDKKDRLRVNFKNQ